MARTAGTAVSRTTPRRQTLQPRPLRIRADVATARQHNNRRQASLQASLQNRSRLSSSQRSSNRAPSRLSNQLLNSRKNRLSSRLSSKLLSLHETTEALQFGREDLPPIRIQTATRRNHPSLRRLSSRSSLHNSRKSLSSNRKSLPSSNLSRRTIIPRVLFQAICPMLSAAGLRKSLIMATITATITTVSQYHSANRDTICLARNIELFREIIA